jgi:Cu/Ag efflux pump CusA
MPADVLPEFSPPFVEIQTEALGLSAEEVEQMITVPMEQDLIAGVAWLDVIRSESVPGLSSVVIFFEPGTDLFRARQMVSERLAQAAVGLPHVSKPPTMIQPQSSASRFMIVGLSSKDISDQIMVLARWVISPRLLGVPGNNGYLTKSGCKSWSIPSACKIRMSHYSRSSKRRATRCGCRR